MNKVEKKAIVYLISVFVSTLFILTFARYVAGSNPYIYAVFPTVWFVSLFVRDIQTKREMLSSEWNNFKEKKWKNILFVILTVILLVTVIQVSRPFFNNFVPDKKIASLNFSIDTWLGLFLTVMVGVLNLGVAFVEEIAYRYEGMYLFKSNKVRLVIMLIVSSILFGFSHYYNFNASFLASGPYVIAGLIFGCMYLFTKNIWVPILAHIIFNSTDVISGLILVVLHIFAQN